MFDPKAMIKTIAKAAKVPKMTSGQVFETVATHLFMQGNRAMDTGNTCVYRGMDGTKCAMGVLVPDSAYDKKWDDDGVGVGFVLINGVKALKHLSKHTDVLTSLQAIHDSEHNWTSTEHMQGALNRAIGAHRLSGIDISHLKFADR